MTKMTHPESNHTIDPSPSQVPLYEANGWVRKTPAPAKTPAKAAAPAEKPDPKGK
jgi:hypothetical protein